MTIHVVSVYKDFTRRQVVILFPNKVELWEEEMEGRCVTDEEKLWNKLISRESEEKYIIMNHIFSK